jgi:hypothetical protein
MSEPTAPLPPPPVDYPDAQRLELVTVSVGFDDLLDITLGLNHPHVDTLIVITSHADKKTHAVCHKHGAACVQTDLFTKNGRSFNKGAAINAGFGYFQYHGWRLHLDADIALPDNTRRILFTHTHLDRHVLYGADRVDVVGREAIDSLRDGTPQHRHTCLVQPRGQGIGARFVTGLHGYLPLGFFQLWHAHAHKPYPYSLGTAAHDDTMFSALWPRSHRHLVPTLVVHHLCVQTAKWGENWERRTHPRLREKVDLAKRNEPGP